MPPSRPMSIAMFWITQGGARPSPGGGGDHQYRLRAAPTTRPDNLVDYAQTKSCIVSFTKGMAAKQLAPQRDPRQTRWRPGPIWTPLQPSGGSWPEQLAEIGARDAVGTPRAAGGAGAAVCAARLRRSQLHDGHGGRSQSRQGQPLATSPNAVGVRRYYLRRQRRQSTDE